MIYDYLTTIFKLIAGIIDKNVLIIIAAVFMLVLTVWIILSLSKSSERKFIINGKKLIEYIDNKPIVYGEDVRAFELVNAMPAQFVRGLKTAQFEGGQLPGRYLNQSDCLDTPLYGGLFNQNRSLIKTITYIFTTFLALFSLAISLSSSEDLTGLVVAQSLVLPLVALTIYKVEYYVYTSIRQYYYRLAVATFNELVDALDDNFEQGKFTFEKCEEDSMNENVDEKRGRGRPKKVEEVNYLEINSDQDFERALERAEKLIGRLNKDLSGSQKRRTSHELKEVMASLADYEKRRKK